MSVLVDKNTRLLVQGITGREGGFHAQQCRAFGTKVVAGMTPGKGGSDFEGIPVFNTVEQAVRATGANTSIIFVPAPFAADAILEAADSGIGVIACITEGIPTWDMIAVRRYLERTKTYLIGPNCPGLVSPGQAKVGIMPNDIFQLEGPVAVLSRSGTLTYEAAAQLTERKIGQSTCLGLGGDPIIGTTFAQALRLLEADAQTELVVLIGEIGGTAEQEAAEVMATMSKPVVAFIGGATAPPGRRMGHAGAIITGAAGTAQAKIQALKAVGATIAPTPADIGATAEKVLKGLKAQGLAPAKAKTSTRKGR
ncbi:MAG: succinate--CoA ligase subunit alpha [Chloroflexi bacterium]|nr:succinate--CoA ligase subunit alpha [Chloroflexota bacterium]